MAEKEIKMKTTTVKHAKENALKNYEQEQAEIRKLIKQIEAGLEKHDRAASGNPGGHHWGHVGDLKHMAAELREIRDRLHGLGEYKIQGL
jgi:hypothetical protein